MQQILELYRQAGAVICHQLPSRTLLVSGVPLPVCARDTGIYTGMLISLFYLVLLKRLKSDKPPGIGLSSVLCLFMLPMLADGTGSYMGIWSTNNLIRLVTGTFFGAAIPFFLIPAASFRISAANRVPVLKSWYELPAVAVICLAFDLVLFKDGFFSWFFISSLVFTGLIFFVGRIAYTLAARMKIRAMAYRYGLTMLIMVSVFMLMYLISNFILQPFRDMLLN